MNNKIWDELAFKFYNLNYKEIKYYQKDENFIDENKLLEKDKDEIQ